MLKDPFFGAELPAAFPKSENRPVVARLSILHLYTFEVTAPPDECVPAPPESFPVGEEHFDRHHCIDMSPSTDPKWNYLYTYTLDSASRNVIFAIRVQGSKESYFSQPSDKNRTFVIMAQRPSASREVDTKLSGIPCSRCKIIIDFSASDADTQNPLCLNCFIYNTNESRD